MFKNNRAESFAWIIVWVFILAFVILWIVNIITYSRDSVWWFETDNILANLKMNYESIIGSTNIDFSWLSNGDEFYIEKDPILQTYSLLTWATNSDYQYVDSLWVHVPDTLTYEWNIYIAKWIFYWNSTIIAEDASTTTVPLYKIITSSL